MKPVNIKMKRKPKEKFNFTKTTYAVVKFIERRIKLFESIPESWFVDEERTACFWPPKGGRSVTLRAIDQDVPDWDWEVYECTVVSLGHETYSIASSIVREKCSQRYNTSSADDHIEVANFKRAHPGLVHKGEQNLEKVFEKARKKVKDNLDSKPKKPEQNIDDIDKEVIVSLESPPPSTTGTSNIEYVELNNINESHHSVQTLPENVVPRNSDSAETHQKGSNAAHNTCTESDENKNHHRTENSKLVESYTTGIITVPVSRQNSTSTSKADIYARLRKEFHSRSKLKCSRRLSRDSIRSLISRSSIRSTSHRSGSRSSRRSGRNSIRSTSHGSSSRSTRRSGSRSTRRSSRNSVRSASHRSRSRSTRRSGSRSSRRSSRSSIVSATHRSRSRSIRRSGRNSIRSTSHRSGSRCSRRSGHNSTWSTSHRSSSRSTRRSGSRSSRCSRHNYTRSTSHRSSSRSIGRSGRSSIRSTSPRSVSRLIRRSNDRSSRHSGSRSSRRSNTRARQSLNTRSSRHRSKSHASRRVCSSSRKTVASRAGLHVRGDCNYRGENDLLKTLTCSVDEMRNILNKIERRNNENDRRLNRVEVTSNKTLVLVGDLVNAHDARMSLGNVSRSREVRLPRGYRKPKLPVKTREELSILKRDLKKKDFFSFLVNDQKQYCTPSRATDNVIMTGFLKRFISVRVRANLVLKDLKGKTGKTLYNDFREVYDFIIEVFKAGYEVRNKIRTNPEVQSVLRVVWGRSKQMLNEGKKKKK